MCADAGKLRSLISLLLVISLAFGTPVAMSMEVCNADRPADSSQADDSKHTCCQDQERHSDSCQGNDCECHAATGGAIASVTTIADNPMVAVVPTFISRVLISTVHDLPERPPRHA